MVNPLSQSISQSRWEHKYFFLALLFSGIIDRFLKSKSELYIWRLCPIQISFSFFFFFKVKSIFSWQTDYLTMSMLHTYIPHTATHLHTGKCMYIYVLSLILFIAPATANDSPSICLCYIYMLLLALPLFCNSLWVSVWVHFTWIRLLWKRFRFHLCFFYLVNIFIIRGSFLFLFCLVTFNMYCFYLRKSGIPYGCWGKVRSKYFLV